MDKALSKQEGLAHDLSGQVGIVTGSASGIGREMALTLAKRGATLVLADINYKGIKEVESSISEYGRALAIETDVSSDQDVKSMVEKCLLEFGRVDFLCSNAGIVGPYNFEDTTAEAWDRVFEINTKGMFLCAKYVLPSMIEQKYGRIVFTGSTNAEKPGGYVIAYRASKAAVVMLARSLALYAAPHNITVNAVCPGVVLTPIERQMIKGVIKERGITFEEYVENRAKRVPMGRFTTEADIANAVEFLVSEKASFITGQAIFVNGGEW